MRLEDQQSSTNTPICSFLHDKAPAHFNGTITYSIQRPSNTAATEEQFKESPTPSSPNRLSSIHSLSTHNSAEQLFPVPSNTSSSILQSFLVPVSSEPSNVSLSESHSTLTTLPIQDVHSFQVLADTKQDMKAYAVSDEILFEHHYSPISAAPVSISDTEIKEEAV